MFQFVHKKLVTFLTGSYKSNNTKLNIIKLGKLRRECKKLNILCYKNYINKVKEQIQDDTSVSNLRSASTTST